MYIIRMFKITQNQSNRNKIAEKPIKVKDSPPTNPFYLDFGIFFLHESLVRNMLTTYFYKTGKSGVDPSWG